MGLRTGFKVVPQVHELTGAGLVFYCRNGRFTKGSAMQAYESGDERGDLWLRPQRAWRRTPCRTQPDSGARPAAGESLWLHWDRGVPEAQAWLRDSAGLSEFACDLLLEEATRPRLLDLGAESLLVFLRGVNLNPGAEPEDMVSLRVFADARRVISLRLRAEGGGRSARGPGGGKGPKTASEVVYYLAHYLTDRVDTLISGIADQLDAVEELVEADERASPDQHQLRTLRRRSAGCGATWRRSGTSTRNWRATSCPGSSRTTPITGTS